MTRTKEQPNSTNLRHTRIALPPCTTERKITSPRTSSRNKRSIMPREPLSGRRKRIENLHKQRRSHNFSQV